MSSFREKNRWGYLIPKEESEISFTDFEDKIKDLIKDDNNWQGVYDKWKKVNAIYMATEKNISLSKSLNLSDVMDMDIKLNKWFESASKTMQYPPSDKDFIKAFASSIGQDMFRGQNILQNEVSLLFLQMCPSTFISSVRLVKQNFKDHKMVFDNKEIKLLLEALSPSFNQSEKSKENLKAENKASTKSIKETNKEKPNPTHPLTETIKGWLETLKQQEQKHQSPQVVLQSTLNGLIKESVIEHKGMHDNALNYWFEDLALPAILSLDIEDLEKLSHVWPKNSIATFVSPSKTMESGTFLRNMVGIRNPERSFIVNDLLPKLINGSPWSNKERVAMLDAMIERTKDHPWLFKERLSLWQSWGGDLSTMISLDNEPSSLLRPQNLISIENKLRKENNDGWNKVLDELLSPPISKTQQSSKMKLK